MTNKSVILAGIGRSGTTWVGDIINHKNNYRVLFEPFHPKMVKEAKDFKYIQYLHPNTKIKKLQRQANKILTGNIEENEWINRNNEFSDEYNSILIKEIRCNLMLGWLQKISSFSPIVLVIRHPLQVLSSWKKLNWIDDQWVNIEYLDDILSNKILLEDFPVITATLNQIDPTDYVQNFVFRWGVFNLVPLTHLKLNNAYILFYENLVTNYKNEVISLFDYLQESFGFSDLEKLINTSSSTNFNHRNFTQDRIKLIDSWKDEFSTENINKTEEILDSFGLKALYDSVGQPYMGNINENFNY